MKRILQVLLAVIFLLVLGVSVKAAEDYYFEFYNFHTNQIQKDPPISAPFEIIVASRSQDVRNTLPQKVSQKQGDKISEKEIPNDPGKFCRGSNGCSVAGNVITDSKTSVSFVAKDKNGNTLAVYGSVANPTNQSDKVAKTSNNSPQVQVQSENSSNNWWISWWQVGFWTGILWIFLWVFVGWQWTKYRFWGFGWPWPWWFWIPIFWWIPWLVVGWQWWLVWWPWWIWIWWIFPWVFWPFWWLIVFKEAIIWMWKR